VKIFHKIAKPCRTKSPKHAKSIDLKLKGDMVNSGLMAARGNLSIDAANITNLTGTIKGLDISLVAAQDIQSIQGNISAGNNLKIGAGNDVVIKGGSIAAGGSASITAGNDLLLIAQDKGRQVSGNFGKRDKDGKLIDPNDKSNSFSYGTYDQTGVNINIGGNLNLSAGRDFFAQGAQVNAGGGVSISAGRDASVTTALKGSSYDYNRVTTTRNGIFGKQTRTITTRETDLTNTASTLNAGGGANITAGRDLTLQGTNINAAGINLSAGNNVNVLAAYDVKEKTDINSLKSNFKGGSTTNIELDKKAMVSNLNGNNGAVNITAGNTITLEGTNITGSSFAPTAQKTNLLAAMDTKTSEHTKTSNNLVWQSTQSKGTTSQVMHLTNINVPVGMSNFQGAGGITVQLPKNASLTEQITSLAKQPGNEYLTDLAARSDIDWQRVEVINKSWDYKKEGLTPAASIVVAIVVAIATAGAASSAAGSLVGTTTVTTAGVTTTTLTGTGLAASAGMSLGVATATTAAVTAGITALATSATLAIINNKGDIGAALKELGSKENIKSLVTAMATAGLVQGLGAALNLPSTGLGSSFIDKLQTNLVNGIASSLITTAINGGSVEDAIKNAVKGAVINSIAAQGANGIGNLTNDGKLDQTALENFANKFAHAVLGCATGAATANSQAGCAAGAVGAVAGGLGAELYDPANVKGVDAQQFGKLTASLAVLLAGGDAKLVNVAGTTAVNAIANNRQLHPKEIDWIKENAASYAKLKGISLVDAEKALAEQAFRQVQFGAEGGAASWDASASDFLRKAGPLALSEGGFMFYATPEQKANSMMYIGSAVTNADFYKTNGLTQPTIADINKAAVRDAQIRANLGTATNTAFAAAATLSLVGLSPTMLTWALTHPLEATTAGIITADTAAAITSGAVTPNSMVNATQLRTQLAFQEAGILNTEGKLTQQALSNLREIPLAGGVIKNPTVVAELTKDGSKIEDWGKYTTQTVKMPNGQPLQIHFYQNTQTGVIDYFTSDFKVKGVVVP
jgi:Possible hemagglutinin (DUF637)/Hemagglutinin repeat